ncbi:MAG: 1-deoxy-D-xylulose-5-phosphate reductoisomerase [Oscillospiraceae bacterium]|nr:1-deoxy-D-xylulose-5-phosphate reductoisomerase [Oscillospiraceae bacterium]
MKNAISVLGSTGSIGRQTLDVAKHLSIPVVALTAGSNVERMAQQCREFQPLLAVMGTEEAAKALRLVLPNQKIQIMSGKDGLLAAASIEEAATVITAVVGMVGLEPTLAAIRAGKRIGLANKETLVCAGQLVMEEADRYGAEIIPVDSEHSAIFQCLMGCQSRSEVKKLILTCSGGPFFGKSREELRNVTKDDALKHPNWKMGAKITIDCATLMNKGLEFIEAMRLYRLPPEKIQIVIHRQSVVHSLVEFVDGAVMAQLGTPDMRLPIQLALTYPNRLESPVEALDLLGCGALTFQQPDEETFPCLKLARDAARLGGTAGAVLSGANEAAVSFYLQNIIGFYDIYELVRLAMEQVPYVEKPTLEEILEADRLARAVVADYRRGDLT